MKNRIEAKRYKRNVRKEFMNYSERDRRGVSLSKEPHTLLNEVPLRTENESYYNQPCKHSVKTHSPYRITDLFLTLTERKAFHSAKCFV